MIYLASDHRGFKLKEKIKEWLSEWGKQYEDCGPFEYNETDDYPDLVKLAAEKVSGDPQNSKAIILGATGQGEAIVANRYKGVRAVVYYGGPLEIITLSRKHNNSNILSLGAALGNTTEEAKPSDETTMKEGVKLWLETEFENEERHIRRIKKIDALN